MKPPLSLDFGQLLETRSSDPDSFAASDQIETQRTQEIERFLEDCYYGDLGTKGRVASFKTNPFLKTGGMTGSDASFTLLILIKVILLPK